VIAKIAPEFELTVFLAEEGFKHLVVDGVPKLVVARPSLETAANDAVDPGDRFFFVRYVDPPETRLHAVRLSLVQKHPRRPFSEGAEDLVVNRADLFRNLVGRDPLAPLLPHQDDFVAHFTPRNLADVERAHVHGDPACNGNPFPPDQRLPLIGKHPSETVAVSDRNRGDAGRPPRNEGPPVSDAVSFGEFLDQDHPRFETHHRGKGYFVPRFCGRIKAVGDDARTHHVQVTGGVVQHGPAVGNMAKRDPDAVRLQLLQNLPEPSPLQIIVVGEDFALGEMAEDPFQNQVGKGSDFMDHPSGFGLNCAAPPHPRVHLHMDRHADVRPAGLFLKLPRKAEVGQRRGQVVLDDLVDLGAGGGGKDQDGGRDPAHPELNPLVGIRHPEAAGAVFQGGVGDLDRPMAVGIRLDHLHDLDVGADPTFHLRPVCREMTEIDLDPTPVFLIIPQTDHPACRLHREAMAQQPILSF